MEDPTGKLRLYKCKGMAGLYAPRMQALMARGPASLSSAASTTTDTNLNSCNCAASAALQAAVVKRKRLFPKKSEFPAFFWRSTIMGAIFRFTVSVLSCVLSFKRYHSCLQSFAKRAVYPS